MRPGSIVPDILTTLTVWYLHARFVDLLFSMLLALLNKVVRASTDIVKGFIKVHARLPPTPQPELAVLEARIIPRAP